MRIGMRLSPLSSRSMVAILTSTSGSAPVASSCERQGVSQFARRACEE